MHAHRTSAVLRGLLGLLIALTLTGCFSVPTTGQVKKVRGEGEQAERGFEIEGQPPRPGDQPRVVVDGFLQAMANYQAGYPVARQYLTRAAAESWRPEAGVSIYTGGPPITEGNKVVLTATLSASLGADKAFTQRDQPLRHDFRVIKEHNEWRISNPPKGLMLSQYKFDAFYQSYNLYFFEPQYRWLVPDPIFLPKGVPTESALIQALLRGPTDWLKPSVVSVIPPKTGLSVQSVSVTAGIAEINFSDDIMALTEEQRSLMAAQVNETLGQVIDASGSQAIDGVRFKVNGLPYPIAKDQVNPDGDVPIDALKRFDPVSGNTSLSLYGVTENGVMQVDDSEKPPGVEPVPGPLGNGKYAVTDLAVSADTRETAVVTNDGHTLRSGPSGKDPTIRVDDVDSLLRPQYDRYGDLWSISRTGGKQTFQVFRGEKAETVDAKTLASSNISAFRISPDGVRMVLIRKVGNHSELGLARINRADTITVDGWRTIKLTGTGTAGLSELKDVAWIDETTLMLLGAASADVAFSPSKLDQDAATVTPAGLPDDWDATELSASAAGPNKAVVVGKGSRSWKFQGEMSWPAFSDKFSALAYPG